MRIFPSRPLALAVFSTCSLPLQSVRWRDQLDLETGSSSVEGDHDPKVRTLTHSPLLSVHMDPPRNMLLKFLTCGFITCFYCSVADNHQFLHEAYISDDLVKAIHRFMKLHPKGIPLTDFTAKFEVTGRN